MATYEDQYMKNLKDILKHGTRETNARTGIETYRLPSTQIIVDLEKEFPILRSKKVFWKSWDKSGQASQIRNDKSLGEVGGSGHRRV